VPDFMRGSILVIALMIALLTTLYSQQSVSWRDPSPHAIHFVTVDGDESGLSREMRGFSDGLK
jgi:hypothetical protein